MRNSRNLKINSRGAAAAADARGNSSPGKRRFGHLGGTQTDDGRSVQFSDTYRRCCACCLTFSAVGGFGGGGLTKLGSGRPVGPHSPSSPSRRQRTYRRAQKRTSQLTVSNKSQMKREMGAAGGRKRRGREGEVSHRTGWREGGREGNGGGGGQWSFGRVLTRRCRTMDDAVSERA